MLLDLGLCDGRNDFQADAGKTGESLVGLFCQLYYYPYLAAHGCSRLSSTVLSVRARISSPPPVAHALSTNHSPADIRQAVDSEMLASDFAVFRQVSVSGARDCPKGGLPLVRAAPRLDARGWTRDRIAPLMQVSSHQQAVWTARPAPLKPGCCLIPRGSCCPAGPHRAAAERG